MLALFFLVRGQMEKYTRYRTLRGLFKDRKRWTQGEWVRHKRNGQHAFCLLGGLDECYGEETPERGRAYEKVAAAIREEGWYASPMTFNDQQTFKDVQRIVRKAGV